MSVIVAPVIQAQTLGTGQSASNNVDATGYGQYVFRFQSTQQGVTVSSVTFSVIDTNSLSPVITPVTITGTGSVDVPIAAPPEGLQVSLIVNAGSALVEVDQIQAPGIFVPADV